ncbi:hypothetical protein BH09MYX1_BH09MYX1_26420 [soil metagenome]
MKPVERSEILSIGDYEAIRPHFRTRIIGEKRVRRVHVGDRATAVFENHDTALLQIQEMLRTERITREGAITHEIETYNELVPADRELSCTIMINVEEKDVRDKFLSDLRGVERKIALEIDRTRFAATWNERRVEPDRASAVLYLKFPLDDAGVRAVKDAARGEGSHEVTLVIDHEVYRARATLDRRVLSSLAEDLA